MVGYAGFRSADEEKEFIRKEAIDAFATEKPELRFLGSPSILLDLVRTMTAKALSGYGIGSLDKQRWWSEGDTYRRFVKSPQFWAIKGSSEIGAGEIRIGGKWFKTVKSKWGAATSVSVAALWRAVYGDLVTTGRKEAYLDKLFMRVFIKRESAKQRIVTAVQIASYMLGSYINEIIGHAKRELEDVVTFWTNEKRLGMFAQAAKNAGLSTSVPIDFEKYDRKTTTEVQVAWAEGLRDAVLNNVEGLPNEVRDEIRTITMVWAHSFAQGRVVVPKRGSDGNWETEELEIIGGLISGIKFTALAGGMLNDIYCKLVSDMVLSTTEYTFENKSQGDDILGSLWTRPRQGPDERKMLEAVATVYAGVNSIGMVTNPLKVFTANRKQGVNEFLRRIICRPGQKGEEGASGETTIEKFFGIATSGWGNVIGYPGRAIAIFEARPTNAETISMQERVQGVLKRWDTMQGRGWDVKEVEAARDGEVARVLKMDISVVKKLLHTPASRGGLGVWPLLGS